MEGRRWRAKCEDGIKTVEQVLKCGLGPGVGRRRRELWGEVVGWLEYCMKRREKRWYECVGKTRSDGGMFKDSRLVGGSRLGS